jgi:hypothetical protein
MFVIVVTIGRPFFWQHLPAMPDHDHWLDLYLTGTARSV